MRDGTVLMADIYRPDDGGRHPVLLLRTPYWKLNPRYINTARNLAERGYTVICQDMRGRYDSEGDARREDLHTVPPFQGVRVLACYTPRTGSGQDRYDQAGSKSPFASGVLPLFHGRLS